MQKAPRLFLDPKKPCPTFLGTPQKQILLKRNMWVGRLVCPKV